MQSGGGKGKVGLGALPACTKDRGKVDQQEQGQIATRDGLQGPPHAPQDQPDPQRKLCPDGGQKQGFDQ